MSARAAEKGSSPPPPPRRTRLLTRPLRTPPHSLVLGFLYCYFVTGLSGALHPLFSSLFVYVLASVAPRKHAPSLVFLFAMAYMSASHIYRLYYDYLGWNLDYTTAQMIVTVKVCMYAYNVADGKALNAGERLSEREKTHQFREARAVRENPSVLEFLSYIFFFPSVLAGPTFEIREYLDFTSGALFKRDKLRGPPSALGAMGRQFAKCLLFYGGVVMAGKFPIMGYVNTPAFFETTFLYRVGYIVVAPAFFRYKYYFAWYLSEIGCLSSGLGYGGLNEDGSVRWDAVTNCHALRVEFARSLPELTNNWNMGVNHWLKHYVYFRVEQPAALKKVMPNALFCNLVTKLTSALWHGFYPAYYLFFVSAVLNNMADNEFRRVFRPLFFNAPLNEEHPKSAVGGAVYYVVSWFLTISFLNYLGMAFAILRFDWSLAMWTSVYFYGHIGCFLAVVVLKLAVPAKRRPRKAAAAVTPAPADASPSRKVRKSPRRRTKKAE